jgi:GNAT superfamily N-acetyltransferase
MVVPDEAQVPMARAALAGLAPANLTTPEVVMARFGGVAEVWGPAALFYPTAPLRRWSREDQCSERAEPEQLGDLLDDAGTEYANESGLSKISAPAFVVRDGAAVVAACGWRLWPGGIAHLCVLTRPAYRRRGLARTVAAQAIEQAAAEGLVPQWRARPVASQHLAQSLGLVRLGTQLSLRLV